jgi:hypothetical protein
VQETALRPVVGGGGAGAGFSCKLKDCDPPPALAVREAVCAVLTEATVAENPALVEFAGTATVPGTLTAALLLDRVTVVPPLGAAEDRVTVQASDPAPVIEPLLHERLLRVGCVGLPPFAPWP